MTQSFASAQLGGSPQRKYYTGSRVQRARSIADLRARTHRLMPRFVLEYLEGGAGDEATLRREREAFAEWRVMPRTLTGLSGSDPSAAILEQRAAMPLIVAPTGLNGIFRRHADTALAAGAARSGVPFVQSTMSNDTMERVSQVEGLRHWWQLYVFGGEEVWQELVDRAAAAGCEALVLTTNAQVFGRRNWDRRGRRENGFPAMPAMLDAALHPRWAVGAMGRGLPDFVNVRDFVPGDRRSFFDVAQWIREAMRISLDWKDVEAIRQRWKKPFLLKGLLNLQDVARARDSGVDGIILSSHGGRQADWAVSPLDMLESARRIVGDDIGLFLSGGVRTGADILKALALGADAVLAGRAPLYGLCAYGERGVHASLDILRCELANEMAQCGIADLADRRRDLLISSQAIPLNSGS